MPWIKSCLCHQEKKKSPTISPPIHLLLKNEDSGPSGPSHAFRSKTFKKPRPCHLCHQLIIKQGSCCRVCKYVCHSVCESKEAAQRYTDTSLQIHRQESTKKKSHPSDINNLQSATIDYSSDSNSNKKQNGSDTKLLLPPGARKIVQIETVETSTSCPNAYESVNTYQPVTTTKVDVLLKPSASLQNIIQSSTKNLEQSPRHHNNFDTCSKYASLPRLDNISTVNDGGSNKLLRMSSLDRRNVRRFVEVEVKETTTTFHRRQPSKLTSKEGDAQSQIVSKTEEILKKAAQPFCQSSPNLNETEHFSKTKSIERNVVALQQPKLHEVEQSQQKTTTTTKAETTKRENINSTSSPPVIRQVINYCSDSESSERTNKIPIRKPPRRFIEVQTIETTTKFVPFQKSATLPKQQSLDTFDNDSSVTPQDSKRGEIKRFNSESNVCYDKKPPKRGDFLHELSTQQVSKVVKSPEATQNQADPRREFKTEDSTTSYEPCKKNYCSNNNEESYYTLTSDTSGDEFYSASDTNTNNNYLRNNSTQFDDYSTLGSTTSYEELSRLFRSPTPQFPNYLSTSDLSGEEFYENKKSHRSSTLTPQNRWSSYETNTHLTSAEKRLTFPQMKHRNSSFWPNSNQSRSYQLFRETSATPTPQNFNEIFRIVSHTHDDTALNNGASVNKMLTTSNSYNGFGEALTSQPRSSRGGGHPNGSGPTINMDLSYVTERIISLYFPPATTHHSYRLGQRQAAHMLRNKHGDNYMVFNLSEPKRALRSEHKHVKEVGWNSNLAPPLEKLCSVCKDIDSWLSGDQHRIAVLHARGSKDKLGVIVAAYMHYSSICGSAEQALDRFSMRKFLDDNVGPLLLPSNKRYVEYFAGLLSHHIKVNAAPLYLTHVTVLGAPSFQHGGCRAFLKLYEGHTVVYTSGIYSVSSGVSQFTVNVAGERRRGLQLRGDILIKCYHRADTSREKVFACQFHTCAVTDYTLSFTKQELDLACNDARFPIDGAVELHFSPGPEARHPAPAPTPAVPFTLVDDPVTRADSPLHVEESDEDGDSDSDDVNHTFGPLDGSIYATIAKKPELSPGAVSSPLTVSMDSGISSAGHQQNANTNASTSPPLTTAQPSPLTPEEQHRELDELLNNMLLTVESIPDPKPQDNTDHFTTLENVRYIDDVDIVEDNKNIPYHARQDSRPFTYGVNSTTMITDTKTGLSSPSLVRKASINKSSGDTLKKVQTQVFPDYSTTKPVPNFATANNNNNYKYSTYSSSPSSTLGRSVVALKKDPIDDIFTESALRAQPIKREFREEYYRDEIKRYDPLKRSLTEGTIRRSPEKVIADYKTSSSVVTSPYSDSESLSPPGAFRSSTKSPEFHETFASKDLTWLQRQQQKLKERREVQLREERHPHEIRLMSELRSAQSRHMRPTASHRLDGYTSDTTAFADDDDDYTIPLHINTKQPSSRTYNVSKTIYTTTKNERPFMAVKRAHEQYAQNEASAAQILAANPLGQIIRPSQQQLIQHNDNNVDQVDSGLLSLVEQQEREHFNTLTSTTSRHQHHHQISPRSNNSNNINNSQNLVGIQTIDSSTNRIEALSDLIASLSSSGSSDKSSNSSNYITTPACHQYREESINSWRSQSVNEMDTSPSHSSSPRPQTPAFPVHARTPYFNSSASNTTVQFDIPSERLPPKSPTTQRRLSFPSSSSSFKNKTKWSLSPERKDRPTSPSDLTNGLSEYQTSTMRSVSTTPPALYRDNYQETYQYSSKSPTHNGGSASPTVYFGNSRRSSIHSNSEPPQEVSPAHVKFVRDTSSFWYKPAISREEAINMLRDQSPGTFVVRDSNSFPGAFGMALKVSTLPNNVQGKSYNNDELVRHFLIEPTSRGVRLKGCQNEPVFSSLSALIYQHSVTQMALPCRLILPEGDLKAVQFSSSPAQQIMTQGAACNVIYLLTFEMESLTGPEAIKKAVVHLLKKNPQPENAIVHFKVNGQGITLTDNKRKLFFRRHYPINTISHCGIDPDEHTWTFTENRGKSENRIFGFVARKPGVNNPDNQCHLFAELEPEQPATAIVNFVNKILTSSGIKPNIV